MRAQRVVRIPKSFEKGLAVLIRFSDDEIQGLYAALERAEPALQVEDLADRVASDAGVPPMKDRQVHDVLLAIAGLFLLIDKDTSPREIVEDIADALGRSDDPDLHVEGPALQAFRKRLLKLLSFEHSLGLTAKATDVKFEHERGFCTARVLTDLRPVFPLRNEGAPEGFVICHTLHIRFHPGSPREHDEFCLAIDQRGVDELIDVLERAKRKEATLEALLKDSRLTVFQSKDEPSDKSADSTGGMG